jgi:hypothetical protein
MPDATLQAHERIVDALLASIDPQADAPVSETVVGGHMVAVHADNLGLASRIHEHGKPAPDFDLPGEHRQSALALAGSLALGDDLPPLSRSMAMAAVNALLPKPDGLADVKGQDLLLERARGGRVAVIGHFPFVERLRGEFSDFTVLELNPGPGDTPAADAGLVLPEADAVAVTSTTIINGTLGGLLALTRPEAFVMLLGPSTPFAPALFDFGVNALAGTVITDAGTALGDVRRGMPYRKLGGVKSLTLMA